jgi:hypothetical protein
MLQQSSGISETQRCESPCLVDVAACLDRLRLQYTLPQNTLLLEGSLLNLWNAFGGFENVRNARILDIGCGSDSCYEARLLRQTDLRNTHQPWLCRAIHQLGGIAVGVDCGLNQDEPFTIHTIDVTDSKALAFLSDHSFNAINMRLLLSSPDLAQRVNAEGRRAIGQRLLAESTRLLAPSGKFICFDLDESQC